MQHKAMERCPVICVAPVWAALIMSVVSISMQGCATPDPPVSHQALLGHRPPEFGDAEEMVLCRPARSWVSVTPREDGMVYAVGSATVRHEPLSAAIQRAQENARTELLKQLAVHIEAETDVDSFRQRIGGAVYYRSSVRERITSKPPGIELGGVQIVARCIDQRQDTVFVLVRLDRGKAVEALLHEIAELDRDIDRYMAVPVSGPRIRQIRRLLPVVALASKRRRLERTLSYVSPGTKYGSSSLSRAECRMISLLDGLSVRLYPAGRGDKALEPYITSCLTGRGLTVTRAGSADVTLVHRLQMHTTTDHEIYFVYAIAELEIMDADQKLVEVLRAEVKDGSPISVRQARLRASRSAGRQLCKRLLQVLAPGLEGGLFENVATCGGDTAYP